MLQTSLTFLFLLIGYSSLEKNKQIVLMPLVISMTFKGGGMGGGGGLHCTNTTILYLHKCI